MVVPGIKRLYYSDSILHVRSGQFPLSKQKQKQKCVVSFQLCVFPTCPFQLLIPYEEISSQSRQRSHNDESQAFGGKIYIIFFCYLFALLIVNCCQMISDVVYGWAAFHFIWALWSVALCQECCQPRKCTSGTSKMQVLEQWFLAQLTSKKAIDFFSPGFFQ